MDNSESKKQRQQERVSCNFNLMINDSIVCIAFDISEGGMFILTDHLCEPGAVIKISLMFRNEKIEIQSKVKYCHKGVGIGVMFIDLDDALKDTMKELVDHFKQLIPYSF